MDSQTLFERLMDLIGTQTLDLEKIREAIILKSAHLPKLLYKYRTIDEKGYALNNLRTSTLYLSPANKMNDPYDSAALFDPFDGVSTVELLLKRSELSERRQQEILAAPDQLDAFFRDFLTGQEDHFREADINKVIEKFKKFTKNVFNDQDIELKKTFASHIQRCVCICSLSERLDSLPLWSHYAGNHKGFAMEYDFFRLPSDDLIRNLLWPVSYSGVYDSRSILKGRLGTEEMNNLIPTIAALHKAPDWMYEREWRLVMQAGFSSNGESIWAPLKAVYLGAEIEAIHAQQVTEAAVIANVPVFQMQLVPHEFRMEAIPLD
jgi:hypothetical protein